MHIKSQLPFRNYSGIKMEGKLFLLTADLYTHMYDRIPQTQLDFSSLEQVWQLYKTGPNHKRNDLISQMTLFKDTLSLAKNPKTHRVT